MTDTPAKKSARRKPAAKKTRSRQIVARKSRDAEFIALLRRKCVRAASIGALTAGAEAIPGLGRALGFLFGEVVDATMLSNVQRELVEDTFALYAFALQPELQRTLIDKIRIVGTGASVATDTALRGLVRRSLGRAGSVLTHRVMPIAPIVTSALTNAAITYTVGKRAQAAAKNGGTEIEEIVRAFTGFDERRVYDWTMSAIKGSTDALSNTFAKIKSTLTSRRAPKKSDKSKSGSNKSGSKKPAARRARPV
jgi:uncharacterized protein (DUF697 family)